MLIDMGRGFTIRGISKFTEDVTLFLSFPLKGGLHYKGYIQIYRGCNTFFKFSIERGIIVVKDKIGVISAQLYVTFW